jgi:NAD+ kinase
MLKFAIYGKRFNDDATKHIKELLEYLTFIKAEVFINNDFADFINQKFSIDSYIKLYEKEDKIDSSLDFLISIGGDGTILDTITTVRDSNVPILGINTGRMGFLANNNKSEIKKAFDKIIDNNYRLDQRTLLSLSYKDNEFGENNFALNELTVHRKDSSSMMTVKVFVDGDYLNTYWADGLIVATPTGSTAYSLACGGPILTPGSNNFVITPISSHNLNLRPIVVNDDATITLKLDGRDKDFLTTLDSRFATISKQTTLTIKKANFNINLIQIEGQDFFSTIRSKLMWGRDIRN